MSRLRRWLAAGALRLRSTHHRIRDIPVLVDNSRPDISTAAVLERLGDALDLIDRYTPHYGRHLRRDLAGILVRRYPCRGAYLPESRLCLVELTFAVHPGISVAQIAATILHEGMHARLHALGFPLEMADRARQERFCRRAEIELGRLAPGGAAVLERALASLELSDRDVAPDIDWQVAARRVEEADRRSRKV